MTGPFERAARLMRQAAEAGFALGDHSVPGRLRRGERPAARHPAFAADVTREIFALIDEAEAASKKAA